jgi:shikimate kinase
VALVGARASGKSTLARALARRIHWPHEDGDELLAAKVGCPAGDYLAKVGESGFRALEEEVTLAALTPGVPRILSLGGGAPTSKAIREALGQAGIFVVFLDASVTVLVKRQKASGGRPPLTDLPLEQEVAAVLAERRTHYERVAHLRLESDCANVDACCEAILAKMEQL